MVTEMKEAIWTVLEVVAIALFPLSFFVFLYAGLSDKLEYVFVFLAMLFVSVFIGWMMPTICPKCGSMNLKEKWLGGCWVEASCRKCSHEWKIELEG